MNGASASSSAGASRPRRRLMTSLPVSVRRSAHHPDGRCWMSGVPLARPVTTFSTTAEPARAQLCELERRQRVSLGLHDDRVAPPCREDLPTRSGTGSSTGRSRDDPIGPAQVAQVSGILAVRLASSRRAAPRKPDVVRPDALEVRGQLDRCRVPRLDSESGMRRSSMRSATSGSTGPLCGGSGSTASLNADARIHCSLHARRWRRRGALPRRRSMTAIRSSELAFRRPVDVSVYARALASSGAAGALGAG